jgi:hypothetical protein
MALSFLYQHERGHMHRQWTIERLRTAVLHAERQLEQAIAATLAEDPLRKAIPETLRSTVHDAVVGLVTLFRDHAAGTGDVATLIAREYANCVERAPEPPSIACVRHVLSVVQRAREQYLSA